jgi:hypothetical protein
MAAWRKATPLPAPTGLKADKAFFDDQSGEPDIPDSECHRQARLVARADRQDAGLASFLDAAVADLKGWEPKPRYTLAELLAGTTPENTHDEVDFGPPVGKEAVSNMTTPDRERLRQMQAAVMAKQLATTADLADMTSCIIAETKRCSVLGRKWMVVVVAVATAIQVTAIYYVCRVLGHL